MSSVDAVSIGSPPYHQADTDMKAGYYSNEHLAALAKEARQQSGLTQQQAAEKIKALSAGRISASQSAVAMAENNPEKPYITLRIALIEAFTDYEIEGPLYRLKPKTREQRDYGQEE